MQDSPEHFIVHRLIVQRFSAGSHKGARLNIYKKKKKKLKKGLKKDLKRGFEKKIGKEELKRRFERKI